MTQHLDAEQPIGIFDSGIGGLTIARAIVNLLPNENMIYFGDTAHLPYGEKSVAAIQSYSLKIVHMLLQQHCKAIVIACNSASAAAYEIVKEYVADRALVIDVITPTIDLIASQYANQSIGLIATKATVRSNIYKKKLDALERNIELRAQAAPLLAQAIEEHCHNKKIINSLVDEYLSHASLAAIKALVLACTHYPVIKDDIAQFYNNAIPLIDNAEITAEVVKAKLTAQCLLNSTSTPIQQFYVSDLTESFANHARLFFGKQINLEYYPLWDQ